MTLSARSISRLDGVHPDLVRLAQRAAELSPYPMQITEGLRDRARQQQLVNKGASRTMNSRHLTGRAVDFHLLNPDGSANWDFPMYQEAYDKAWSQAANELGIPIVWGGNWKTLRDGPHIQLADDWGVAGGGGSDAVAGGDGMDRLQQIEAEIARREGGASRQQQIDTEIANREAQAQTQKDVAHALQRLKIDDGSDATFNLADLTAATPFGAGLSMLRRGMDQIGIPEFGLALDKVAQGGTAAFGDEIVAGVNAAASGDTDNYGRFLEAERAQQERFDRENPALSTGAEIAGGAISLAAPGGAAYNAMRGANLATKAAAGGLIAGAEGGLYGFGEGEDGVDARLENAADTAVISGGVGLAIPFAGKVASKILESTATSQAGKKLREFAPAVQEMRDAASALYKGIENSGVVISGQRFGNLALEIGREVQKGGFNRRLHPKSAVALEELFKTSLTDPSFQKLHQLRQIIGDAAKSNEPRDGRIAMMMMNKLDDFIKGMKQTDLVSGSAEGVADDFAQAQTLWGRMRKTEIIEDIIERAGDQASGFENGLRVGFRALLRNKRLIRGFSPDEVKAIRKVARGGGLPNALRALGRLAIARDGASNVVGASIGAGGGAMLGGPVGAVAVPLIGQAASEASTRATNRAAQTARAMAATGQVPGADATRIRAAIERRMMELLGMSVSAIERGSGTP